MPGKVSREQAWVNVSPDFRCWRIVYNTRNKRIFALFERDGRTKTFQALFCSDPTDGSPGSVSSEEGRRQCLEHIAGLGLLYLPGHQPLPA